MYNITLKWAGFQTILFLIKPSLESWHASALTPTGAEKQDLRCNTIPFERCTVLYTNPAKLKWNVRVSSKIFYQRFHFKYFSLTYSLSNFQPQCFMVLYDMFQILAPILMLFFATTLFLQTGFSGPTVKRHIYSI